jgi:uncharacterized protein YndB with AHSA1/START domain
MHELTLTRYVDAPPERVFAAWTQPALMGLWFAPGDMIVPEARSDLRVGGAWRVVMANPDGSRHIVSGVYREVVPPTRLRFTWRWEGSEVTSEVEVQLRAEGAGTELQLQHRELESETSRDQHRKGWEGCLAKLVARCP